MDQPPAVAFTAFTDVWPRARETEIGAALCAIGVGRTLTTGVMAQWLECLPHNWKIMGSSHGQVIPKTLKMVLTAFSSGAQ